MNVSIIHEYLMHAVYFAPRGKRRLLSLGGSLSHRYLSPEDRLVGLVGDAGAGKSLLIRGMFPGLELTNDDDGINVRPLPLLEDAGRGHFRCRTYHLDVRFESAFTPLWEIAGAVKSALKKDHRVVVEHFDLLYPQLKINAEILIGIGEEVIVTRPDLFGPEPQELVEIVFESLIYRRMAHSAEDITARLMKRMGCPEPIAHSDIKHGFVLEFDRKPEVALDELERRVQQVIAADRPVHYHDDNHIKVGDEVYYCTGPRLHVRRTGEIENFRLVKELRWDQMQELYALAGLIGPVEEEKASCPSRFRLIEGARRRSRRLNKKEV